MKMQDYFGNGIEVGDNIAISMGYGQVVGVVEAIKKVRANSLNSPRGRDIPIGDSYDFTITPQYDKRKRSYHNVYSHRIIRIDFDINQEGSV